MKKIILPLFALGTAICSLPADAQSSVTLYGIIDDSITYIHNVAGQSSRFSVQPGQASPRWGLVGTEDLGGGLKAIFRLENGFNINTGALNQGGRMFGRQAYVGLSSATYGTVTLGRQYDAVRDLVEPLQGNWQFEYMSTPGDIDDADNDLRFNNTVKWSSPVWSGLQMVTTYSFGGVPGSLGSGASYSAALDYKVGQLAFAGGLLHIDNGNPTLSARGTTTSDSIFLSAVNSAYSTARAITVTRVAAQYRISSLMFGGYYSFSQYTSDAASTFRGSERYNNGSVYAQWNLTPAFTAQLGYDYLKSSGNSSATYNQLNAVLDYLLSKSTDIYVMGGWCHASGTNGLGTAQAVIGSSVTNSGADWQALAGVGLKHTF
ncbi:porin [Caballeronia sp. LjRoot34]|uniref:porin n=1 Tax=Caballeronia sp. LjRoot34 TaxID=3342325 RepID=UPI003ECCA5C2